MPYVYSWLSTNDYTYPSGQIIPYYNCDLRKILGADFDPSRSVGAGRLYLPRLDDARGRNGGICARRCERVGKRSVRYGFVHRLGEKQLSEKNSCTAQEFFRL